MRRSFIIDGEYHRDLWLAAWRLDNKYYRVCPRCGGDMRYPRWQNLKIASCEDCTYGERVE